MKYWKEFIFFASYLIILLICKAPDISSNFMGFDTLSLFYSCKFLEVRYPVPLYILLGYPLTNLPFGTDGGNLVFLSIISAFISSILVFLTIKNMTDNKIAPWIGAAALMGSYIYFSQSIIVNKYTYISVFPSFMLYFYSKRKYAWSGFFAGLAMVSHYVGGFIPVMAFFCYSKELRKIWYIPIVTFLIIFLGFYIFAPKFYWDAENIDVITRFLSPLLEVFRNITVSWFTDPRALGLLVVSFGLTLIPMALFVIKSFNKSSPYLFILLLPVISYITGDEFRFFTFTPYVPFYAVMAGLGVVYVQTKYLSRIILIFSFLMMLSMPFVLNANSIEENPTTLRDCINQLNIAEDESIILSVKIADYKDGIISDVTSGHIFPMIEYYNRTNGKDLVPMSIVTTDEIIINKLKSHGVNISAFDWSSVERANDESVWHWDERRYERGIRSVCDANPNKHIYYYKLLNLVDGKSQLVKVQ